MLLELNGKQTEFFKALFNDDFTIRQNEYDEFASWGGYASGKTVSVILAIHIICSQYANVNCVVIRETYSQLNDTIIYDFNKLLGHNGYRYKMQPKEAHYPNGSVIRFRAFDQPEKILGGSIDMIVLSQAEQIPHNLFLELFGRQRGATSLPKKLLITEGNPSECWAKVRYNVPNLPPNIFYVHSSTFDNKKFLDKENPRFIPNLIQNLSPNQIKRQLYGDWDTHEEMVFTNFSSQINIIDPFIPPKTYRIAIGGDYGYRNPASFIWGCVDYDGAIILWDEFYKNEQPINILAEESRRHGKYTVVYDYSTKRPDRDGKSVWTELASEGVPLVESNKDELRNITVTNELFKSGRLFICRNCVNLIKEIKNYKWRKIKLSDLNNPKEETVDKDNHAIDAMLYLIAFLEDLKSVDPSVTPKDKTLLYQLVLKKDDSDWIENA